MVIGDLSLGTWYSRISVLIYTHSHKNHLWVSMSFAVNINSNQQLASIIKVKTTLNTKRAEKFVYKYKSHAHGLNTIIIIIVSLKNLIKITIDA